MALGDISYDSTAKHNAGNLHRATGTLEASSTATTFAVLGTSSYIVSASINNIDDDDTTVRVVTNSNNGTEASVNGSLYIQTSSSDVDTHRFDVLYV
jgi:hypothetical protein